MDDMNGQQQNPVQMSPAQSAYSAYRRQVKSEAEQTANVKKLSAMNEKHKREMDELSNSAEDVYIPKKLEFQEQDDIKMEHIEPEIISDKNTEKDFEGEPIPQEGRSHNNTIEKMETKTKYRSGYQSLDPK